MAWHTEVDPKASKVLAHNYPGILNYGDITKIDWAELEPVDILVGGTPCQDVSIAGRRKGMSQNTRSGLWEYMRKAVEVIRPHVVVWENVYGALSAKEYSGSDEKLSVKAGNENKSGNNLGQGQGHMDGPPRLRAIGRVLGDLANLGYDAGWCGLPASEVGACHQRKRIFVVAVSEAFTDSDSFASYVRRFDGTIQTKGAYGVTSGRSGALGLFPELLTAGPVWHDTPYYEAIVRHQVSVGRPAPTPLMETQRGERLSPRFIEWMMMLPEGLISEV